MSNPPSLISSSLPVTALRIVISPSKLVYDADSKKLEHRSTTPVGHGSIDGGGGGGSVREVRKDGGREKESGGIARVVGNDNNVSKRIQDQTEPRTPPSSSREGQVLTTASSTNTSNSDYDLHCIDRSLTSIANYPFNPGFCRESSPKQHPRITGSGFLDRASMVYYLDKIIEFAEYSTVGVYYPLASLLYHGQNAYAYLSTSTTRPLHGVPQPRFGAEGLVMLCNDAGQATIASFAETTGNKLRYDISTCQTFKTMMKGRESKGEELRIKGSNYLQILHEIEEDADTYVDDIAHLTASKKVLLHDAQTSIYERFYEAETRYVCISLLIVFYISLSTYGIIWGMQAKAVVGGFCGGAGSERGFSCLAASFTENVTDDLGRYYGACKKAEAEIWANYLSDPILMDCFWESDPSGKETDMFLREKTNESECMTKIDSWEEALGKGMPKHWDVEIRVSEGESYSDFPMTLHTSTRRSKSSKGEEVAYGKDHEENDNCLMSIQKEWRGVEYHPIEFPKWKGEDKEEECPSNPDEMMKILAETIIREYDRLGSDGVNEWVRDVLLDEYERQGNSRGDFDVLDVGCGLGGTLYSIAAKGLGLNAILTEASKISEVSRGLGGFFASYGSGIPNVKYQGITLSSAEVVMARKEAKKRNLEFPDVRFDQMSFDDPSIKDLKQFSFAIAIESLSNSVNLTATLTNLRESMSPGGVMVVVDLVSQLPQATRLASIDRVNRPSLYQHSEYQPHVEKNDWRTRNDFRTGPSILVDFTKVDPSNHYRRHLKEFGGLRDKEEWKRNFEEAGWVVSGVTDIGSMYEVVRSPGDAAKAKHWYKNGLNEGWRSFMRQNKGRRAKTKKRNNNPSRLANFLYQVGKYCYIIKARIVKLCNRIFKLNEVTTDREISLGRASRNIKEMLLNGGG
eukprot:CAMPEP_0118647662 /NCGR_PEP_ID=MMETSP0785-20121206/8732_1 /TAXON_ID=91992 /ORGANISM="Bolidomonas pacifica, Strain CCMP 1866" /LENGTH=911 /DNA_ID=CAMNT_0006539783 /DNA_START=42 /DNA_END=2773 /DNA_ORIENTATION=-